MTTYDPITCHEKSWDSFCIICEQEEFDKAMHDQIETNYSDELYEYEENK